jgi:predicted NBD/HSP70 family sugar kinase
MRPTENTNNIYYEIIRAVRDQSSPSRASIATYLGRSPATIGRAIDLLISEDVICETGEKRKGSKGRPSKLLELNSGLYSVLTVDLRLTEVYSAVTDLNGNILATLSQRLVQNDTLRSIQELIELIHNLLLEVSELPPVAALVVGAPSIVNSENGIIEWAPSLGWKNIELKKILEEEFHQAVLIENDVNLAALGEYWKGAGQKVKNNILFVSIGTGIGAGIILNGDLYKGATHAAGEVSYFVTDVKVLHDNIGKFGNLESRVGREGLIQMAHLVAQRYPTSRLAELMGREHQSVKTQDILALAETGDAAALVVYNEIVDILTIVISNSAVILDPELIILGGPSDWNWNVLIEAIKDRIGNALLRPVNILPSEQGNNALILGGCYSALGLLPFLQDKS